MGTDSHDAEDRTITPSGDASASHRGGDSPADERADAHKAQRDTERARESEGNRGPDQIDSFGQGA